MTNRSRGRPIVGVALEPFGWHPAAFAEVDGEPSAALSGAHWTRLARAAEQAGADFATFEDSFTLTARDRVSGRLDAAMLASRVAPQTERIGLVPSVTVTHTEPFHASKAIATLDHVSHGRAGVRPQTTASPADAAVFGRRGVADRAALRREAVDYVDVLRDLWDSWEHDTVVKDVATGRFVDRDRLHYIDFEGEFFSVKGPSITPRPPQGRPVVLVGTDPADSGAADGGLAARADIVLVAVRSVDEAASVRSRLAAAGVSDATPVLADVTVALADSERTAARRLAKLDLREPAPEDTLTFAGTGAGLRELITDWGGYGIDGVRIRPAVNDVDLSRLRDALAALGSPPGGPTLRAALGLPAPRNRFATAD
ncbi:LLM class flavin-dependent oxidoreductase [Tsukamurella soli]|uniref:LLM class flavin-dependent oxidoreductase n=1 Tax=Tsukamurella soli TaxID=644556 RepID=UPI0031EE9046